MKVFLMTLLIISSNGQVYQAEREHPTAEACAEEGTKFISQDPKDFGEGARIAFICEPKIRGVPA
jgi:hypothetical protein